MLLCQCHQLTVDIAGKNTSNNRNMGRRRNPLATDFLAGIVELGEHLLNLITATMHQHLLLESCQLFDLVQQLIEVFATLQYAPTEFENELAAHNTPPRCDTPVPGARLKYGLAV